MKVHIEIEQTSLENFVQGLVYLISLEHMKPFVTNLRARQVHRGHALIFLSHRLDEQVATQQVLIFHGERGCIGRVVHPQRSHDGQRDARRL